MACAMSYGVPRAPVSLYPPSLPENILAIESAIDAHSRITAQIFSVNEREHLFPPLSEAFFQLMADSDLRLLDANDRHHRDHSQSKLL